MYNNDDDFRYGPNELSIDPFGDINYFKYNNKCYYMCSVGDNYQDKCKNNNIKKILL